MARISRDAIHRLLRALIESSPARHPVAALLRRMGNMSPCIFCKIIRGEAPARIVFSDERVTAFRDAHPVASTHILIVPNRHIVSVNDLAPEDEPLIGHLFSAARHVAIQEGIAESGYRLIINTGAHGGQTVPHLHLHLIGGRPMRHPMG